MGLPEITNIAKISQPALWFDFNKELYTFLIFVGSEGGNNDHSQVTARSVSGLQDIFSSQP